MVSGRLGLGGRSTSDPHIAQAMLSGRGNSVGIDILWCWPEPLIFAQEKALRRHSQFSSNRGRIRTLSSEGSTGIPISRWHFGPSTGFRFYHSLATSCPKAFDWQWRVTYNTQDDIYRPISHTR